MYLTSTTSNSGGNDGLTVNMGLVKSYAKVADADGSTFYIYFRTEGQDVKWTFADEATCDYAIGEIDTAVAAGTTDIVESV